MNVRLHYFVLVRHYLGAKAWESIEEAAERVLLEAPKHSPSRDVAREVLRPVGTSWNRVKRAGKLAKPKLIWVKP